MNHISEGCLTASRGRAEKDWPGRGGAGSFFCLCFEPEIGGASEKPGLCPLPPPPTWGSLRRGGCSAEGGRLWALGSRWVHPETSGQENAGCCACVQPSAALLPIQAPSSSSQGPQEHGESTGTYMPTRGTAFILGDPNSGHVSEVASFKVT